MKRGAGMRGQTFRVALFRDRWSLEPSPVKCGSTDRYGTCKSINS